MQVCGRLPKFKALVAHFISEAEISSVGIFTCYRAVLLWEKLKQLRKTIELILSFTFARSRFRVSMQTEFEPFAARSASSTINKPTSHPNESFISANKV